MTRRIDALLEEYGESHQNPVNKRVHWVCVPVIFGCVMAFLYSLPAPGWLPGGNWLYLAALLALLYYGVLSPRLAIGFVAVFVLLYGAMLVLGRVVPLPLWQTALILFVLAWLGQFWGHKIEGRRPSFFKDVQFLLIGPAWLLSFVYRRAGLRY